MSNLSNSTSISSVRGRISATFICSTLACIVLAGPASAQTSSGQQPDDTRQLLMELRDELRQTRSQLKDAQQRIEELRDEVKSLRRDVSAGNSRRTDAGANAYISPPDVGQVQRDSASANSSPEDVDDQLTLLQARVEEQHQTKVESASKYRVKLSGLVLFNAFSNHGGVNGIDVPSHAVRSLDTGSMGFTLRQSVLGLQVFGPEIAGAHSGGSITMDFFGGFPQQPFGATSGILRLRTADFTLDWSNTSITAGVDAPFISPLSPTSYATVGEPSFSESGNLWTWTPQVVVEHRLHTSDNSFFTFSGGVLAALTEGVPDESISAVAGPGERSRRPAFGSNFGWQSKVSGQTLKFGIGAYTSHLKYDFGRSTNAWATTSYWQIPLGSRFELSGEAYRGKAVGGLGGGIWQSVVYDGGPALPATGFRPVNAVGGWAQLKVRLAPRWETNFALGQDNVLARDLRWAPNVRGEYFNPLARNRSAFGNVIYHPRSNLVLSAEYRNMRTWEYVGPASTAGQINLAAGVSF